LLQDDWGLSVLKQLLAKLHQATGIVELNLKRVVFADSECFRHHQ
jgi:hypothetical protein